MECSPVHLLEIAGRSCVHLGIVDRSHGDLGIIARGHGDLGIVAGSLCETLFENYV